jgi:CRAL/TRIO domain
MHIIFAPQLIHTRDTIVPEEKWHPTMTTEVSSTMTTEASTWPWMKGRSLAIAEPIAPICAEDERPAVRHLIANHRTQIDEIAKQLKEKSPLFNVNKHDDLWILRFLLSHKGRHRETLEAALKTLEFRAEQKLDAEDIREYPPGPLGRDECFQRYFSCLSKADDFVFDIPHPQRGVVVFLRGAGFDQTKLEKLNYNERLRAFCYINEWTHQWLDFITRTTGRLTKSVRLLDVKGVGLMQVNYQTLRLEGKAINTMQDFYPQLLESFYICDPPTWAHIPWKIVRPLLPTRIVHKIDFVAPGKSKKERKRLRAHVQEEHLPTQYGGQRDIGAVVVKVP